MKAIAIIILDALVWTLLMGLGLALAGSVLPIWMTPMGGIPAILYLWKRQSLSTTKLIHLLLLCAMMGLLLLIRGLLLPGGRMGDILYLAAVVIAASCMMRPFENKMESVN